MRRNAQIKDATVLTTPKRPVVNSEVLPPVMPIERKMVGALQGADSQRFSRQINDAWTY